MPPPKETVKGTVPEREAEEMKGRRILPPIMA
jgi:hypothetical protein